MAYEMLWSNQFEFEDGISFQEMIDALQSSVDELRAMKEAGAVLIDVDGPHATLITPDPAVAKRFGFEELEFDDDEDE